MDAGFDLAAARRLEADELDARHEEAGLLEHPGEPEREGPLALSANVRNDPR